MINATKRIAAPQGSPSNLLVTKLNFGTPQGADNTSMVNAHSADGSTVTPATQPDVPRCLWYTPSGNTTNSFTITGTDFLNAAISEVCTFDNMGNTIIGTHAFKHVNNVTLPNAAGAYNISFGQYSAIGLNATFTSFVPLQLMTDGAVSGTPLGSITQSIDATHISLNWYNLSVSPALNGSRNFILYYLPG